MRVLAGLGVFVGVVFVVIACILVGAGVWARTDAGRVWLAGQLVALVGPVHGTLTIGSLETDLYSGAELRDVVLTDAAGVERARIDRLAATWRLGGLVGRTLLVPTVDIEGLDLAMAQTDAGLDLAAMWDDGSPPSGEPWKGLGIDLVMPTVTVTDARVDVQVGERSYGVAGATLRGAVELRGPAVIVRGLALDAPTTTPALGALALGGDVRWDPSTLYADKVVLALGPNRARLSGGLGRLGADPTVGVELGSLRVTPESLAPLLGVLPVTGEFDATGTITGLAAAPTLLLDVATPGGPVHANATLDTRGARPVWSVSLAPHDLAIDEFLTGVPVPTVVTGVASVEGVGLSWPDDLDATAFFALEAPRVGSAETLAATGAARLSKGIVTIEGLRATAPGAAVRGGGTVRLIEGDATLQIRSSSGDLGQLARFGVVGGRGTAGFVGTADVSWKDGVAIGGSGTLHGDRIGWANVGTVGALDGPATARWDATRGLTAEGGFTVVGVVAGDPPVSALAGRVDASLALTPKGALDVRGTATLAGLSGAGVTGEGLSAELQFARAGDGRLTGEATFTTGAFAWRDWRADRGAGRAHLIGDRAELVLDLWDGDRTLLGFDGEVDIAATAVRARRVEFAPTPEVGWRNDGVQTLRVVAGGVEDVRLRFVSGNSLLAVDGGGRKKGMIDVRAEARDVRLDELATFAPSLGGFGGMVTVRASMEGHASRPALYVDLQADDLTVPGAVRRLDLDVHGVGGDRRLRIDGEASAGGAQLARLEGEVPFSLAIDAPGLLDVGDMDLHLLIPAADAATWNAVWAGEPLPNLRGSLELTLAGPVLDPGIHLVGAVEAPLGARGDWVRVDLDATTRDARVGLRAVVRERLERRAQVEGTIDVRLGDVIQGLTGGGPRPDLGAIGTWLGEIELDVVPLRLPIQTFASLVDGFPTRLTGDLSGGIHLAGPARTPSVEGALLLANGRLGDVPLSPALVSIIGAEGGYTIDGSLGIGNKGGLTFDGFVPFAPALDGDLAAELGRPGLALSLRANGLPLEALGAAWPQIDARAGTLTAAGTISGSLADPIPDVDFGLRDGDFVLALTNVRYQEVAFTGRLGRDELRVDDLVARTDRLSVELGDARRGDAPNVSGRVVARRVDDRPVIEGALTLSRAWIADLPELVLRTDGKLRLADEARKLRITGDIRVLESQVLAPERFFTGTSDLELDPDVQVLRGGATARAARERDAGPSLPRWIDADVSVALDRNTFLDASMPMEQMLGELAGRLSTLQVNTQLDGDVDVSLHEGELSIVGTVQPLRGTAQLFGRRFDIRGEAISFTGRDWIDPVLDLVAVHSNPEYGDITAQIGGTPSALELAFSSEDLSGEDVLAVLVLGRPANDADARESQELSSVLGSAIWSAGTAIIREDLATTGSKAFDLFELDANSLRAGRRLGDRVFLLGSYNWAADATEENAVELTVEVELDHDWHLDFTTGTSGISSVGLNRRWRF